MSTKHPLSAPLLVLLLFSLTLLPSCQPESGPEAEFVSLFNGQDLSGWLGDPRLWTVVDGVIVGSTEQTKLTHNSFLSTRTSYSDFVLRASVKLLNGNSGIQFRGEQFPDYVVKGYQADIAVEKYFGMLYDEGGRGIMEYWKSMTPQEQADINSVARLDDWNLYEIHCQGDRIKMILNGQVVCEIEDPEGASEGIIALQLHTGDPMQVMFKDIEVKDLSDGESKRPTPTKRAHALKHRFTALEGFEVRQSPRMTFWDRWSIYPSITWGAPWWPSSLVASRSWLTAMVMEPTTRPRNFPPRFKPHMGCTIWGQGIFLSTPRDPKTQGSTACQISTATTRLTR